ncbi:hypothetical protein CGMCC3_g11609 [Colletotrichum fructicola]|nr:uncharacterized protein CGMCC3_g11609 [Colletotrichum fructicola]KAE9572170.1 hypothetical protein CGMCC3_g11609 [Colletotrichum fructicola]
MRDRLLGGGGPDLPHLGLGLAGFAAAVAAATLLIRSPAASRTVITPSPGRDRRKTARSPRWTVLPRLSTLARDELPYPPDVFPGARDVDTSYGNLRVYEWGPEDATERVLLLHGIGTPCLALGGVAGEFVRRGWRVMTFDFFGRGYSDAPTDLPYDSRLYTTQILLALASSPLRGWTGDDAFHLLGYSLGGAVAAAFAASSPHLGYKRRDNYQKTVKYICPLPFQDYHRYDNEEVGTEEYRNNHVLPGIVASGAAE